MYTEDVHSVGLASYSFKELCQCQSRKFILGIQYYSESHGDIMCFINITFSSYIQWLWKYAEPISVIAFEETLLGVFVV